MYMTNIVGHTAIKEIDFLTNLEYSEKSFNAKNSTYCSTPRQDTNIFTVLTVELVLHKRTALK